MRANTVIAGVNKAGTTSLFVSLSAHPDVAPAAVKETRYFLPARYGQALVPVSVYESYFASAGDRPVCLEATPSYFYGGAPLVERMVDVCGAPKVIVVLREPVSRLMSFFEFQKARLRVPEQMTLEQYVAAAEALPPETFRTDPEAEKWFGVRGGRYADYLPSWHAALGDDLRIVFFDDLMRGPARVLHELAGWLHIDPDGFPAETLSSENRTTGFKNRGFQRVALAFNDRFERFLRRHYRLKQRMRSAYYRLNGRKVKDTVPADVQAMLLELYREPNARLAEQLRDMGVAALPTWLETPAGTISTAGRNTA
jgi:hypothetical protein